jgi:Uma2 family endonuclease
VVAKKLLTADEFWALPEGEGRRELVRGEVVEYMPVGGLHGEVALEVGYRLKAWARSTGSGYVGVEAGYMLDQTPDSVRAADVSHVRRERIPESGVPENYWKLAPDLAVEVVSPSEKADEVQEKVQDYLVAGTPLVWVVYPRTKQVVIYTPDGLSRTYKPEDALEFPQALPGFSCKVADLFATWHEVAQ